MRHARSSTSRSERDLPGKKDEERGDGRGEGLVWRSREERERGATAHISYLSLPVLAILSVEAKQLRECHRCLTEVFPLLVCELEEHVCPQLRRHAAHDTQVRAELGGQKRAEGWYSQNCP